MIHYQEQDLRCGGELYKVLYLDNYWCGVVEVVLVWCDLTTPGMQERGGQWDLNPATVPTLRLFSGY